MGTPKTPSTPPSRPWTQNQMEPSTPPPSRPSSVPKPTNSMPKNSKTCSESPPLTETSWTTKDWPTLSPTVKPTSKFKSFYFLVSTNTSLLLFIFPPLSSCFSSLSLICCICRPFCYYYFNYRQKKPNIRSS